jgi:hypothetical protein
VQTFKQPVSHRDKLGGHLGERSAHAELGLHDLVWMRIREDCCLLGEYLFDVVSPNLGASGEMGEDFIERPRFRLGFGA